MASCGHNPTPAAPTTITKTIPVRQNTSSCPHTVIINEVWTKCPNSDTTMFWRHFVVVMQAPHTHTHTHTTTRVITSILYTSIINTRNTGAGRCLMKRGKKVPDYWSPKAASVDQLLLPVNSKPLSAFQNPLRLQPRTTFTVQRPTCTCTCTCAKGPKFAFITVKFYCLRQCTSKRNKRRCGGIVHDSPTKF